MRASVPTELHIYPGAPDAFELAAAAKVSPPALRDRFDALSRAFSWSEPEKKEHAQTMDGQESSPSMEWCHKKRKGIRV